MIRDLEGSKAREVRKRFTSPIDGITQAPSTTSEAWVRRCIVTKLEEALNELAKVRTLPELNRYVGALRDAYDVANVAFHLVAAPEAIEKNPLLLVTYEEQWVDRYLAQDYFRVDPIVLVGSSGFLPLDWDSVDRSSQRMRKLFAEAESYGVGNHGLTVPIRGPNREKSLVTVTTFETDSEWTQRRLPLLRDLHVLAHFFHDRCLTLTDLRSLPSRPKLSRREIQCMEALARGRAPKQIAYDLDLSISAVRLYICSAKVKLGASNTNQAIAMVVQDEHIVA